MVYKNTISFMTDDETEKRIKKILLQGNHRSKSHLVHDIVKIGLNEVEKK